jgi:integrase
MATFRKRNGKWQVQVRIHGAGPLSRTFFHKRDAEAWARTVEIDIQRGEFIDRGTPLRGLTLGDLLKRYRDTVTPLKRGRANETLLINALLRHSFSSLPLTAVSPSHFSEYRDARLKVARASTINHELTRLSHVYRIAKLEWGLPVENPLQGIRRPKADQPRTRRLHHGEWEALRAAADECRNNHIWPAIEFAVETGMRRGEILNSRVSDLDDDRRTLAIPITKTGVSRTIALTSRAIAILRKQKVPSDGRFFPITAESLKLAWKRLVKRANIQDLHFHDLRHEAVSRFFEMGLTMPEVALISGHKDPRMLFRYTHLRAEDVAAKLA